MLTRVVDLNLDSVEILDVLLYDFVDSATEEVWVPPVGHQSFLEDLVEECSVDHCRRCVACGFHPVLQHSATHTAERIGNNS